MKFEKGDLVLYCGKVYRVVQVFKHSEMVVIKNISERTDINYVWSWKCRKVDDSGRS